MARVEQEYFPQERQPQSIEGNFRNKDIISLSQFDTDSLDDLFQRTKWMRYVVKSRTQEQTLQGSIVTLLFYEPSSRTKGSFDSAAKRLGGETSVIDNPREFSSVAKGETFSDTIRTFEAYSDLIILRHNEVGKAAEAVAAATEVPIINAGDGTGEHPTQALLDLYTIQEETGRLQDLRVLMAGDILHGRTVHSLLEGLSLYPGNEVTLLSPKELELPPERAGEFERKGLKISQIYNEEEIPEEMDIWYWTRVQAERMNVETPPGGVKPPYVVSQELLDTKGSLKTRLMHPLPRVGEILPEVDNDPRAIYLRSQPRNGLYIRMALLDKIIGK